MIEETFMINQLMTRLSNNDEVKKVSREQGDRYTTRCLSNFAYFEKNYRLIAADLSNKKL